MQLTTPISNNNYFYESAEKCIESSKVWIAAHRSLIELSASFAYSVTLITFVATPLSVPAISLAVLSFLSSSIIQGAYHIYQAKWKGVTDDTSTQPGQHLARTSAAFFTGRAGPQIAIHESGHALMASCCFQNAKPKISVNPFRGGMTSYAISYGLTSFGKLLGKEGALLLISASGIMASTTFALFAFAAAENMKENYPALSECLHYEGVSFIMSEVLYGLTTFIASKEDLTHDFIYMWQKGGIHPIIPIALMIALPLAEIKLLKMRNQAKQAERLSSLFREK